MNTSWNSFHLTYSTAFLVNILDTGKQRKSRTQDMINEHYKNEIETNKQKRHWPTTAAFCYALPPYFTIGAVTPSRFSLQCRSSWLRVSNQSQGKVSIPHSAMPYASWNEEHSCPSDFSVLSWTTWMRIAVWSKRFKANNYLVNLLE